MTIRTFFLLLTVTVAIASCTSKIQQLENRRATLQKEIDDLNRSAAAGKLFENAHEVCMKASKTAEECNVENMKLRQSVIQTIHDDRQELLSIENQIRIIQAQENGNKQS